MPTSKEKAEEEYMRARMGDLSVSNEDSEPAKPDSSADESRQGQENAAEELDSSISAEDAQCLKEEGNELYKAGDCRGAIEKYSAGAKSANAGDELRAVLLANRAAAHLKLQLFRETADDATAALKLKPGYKKALGRRKEARIALKEFRGASEDAKELGGSSVEVARLTRQADEKDEKDKAEALDSLKGLGNSLLGNFGMSLDDFSMDKDPNTGSYSISMKQK